MQREKEIQREEREKGRADAEIAGDREGAERAKAERKS